MASEKIKSLVIKSKNPAGYLLEINKFLADKRYIANSEEVVWVVPLSVAIEAIKLARVTHDTSNLSKDPVESPA